MSDPEVLSFPNSYVRREGLLGASGSVSLPWLRWYRAQFTHCMVFCRGLGSSRDAYVESASFHRKPSCAGLSHVQANTSWRPAVDIRRYGGPFIRISGRSVGKPGILLPASAELVTCRSARRLHPRIRLGSLEPGRHIVMFRTCTISGHSACGSLTGMVGYAAGYLCGRLFRQSFYRGNGIFSTQAEVSDRLLDLAANLDFASVTSFPGRIEIVVQGPALKFAEQLSQGRIPELIYECDDSYWEGFTLSLGEGPLTFVKPDKAAACCRALSRGGRLSSVNVYEGSVRIRPLRCRRKCLWLPVTIEKVNAPITVPLPTSADLQVHTQGLVLKLPVL
jgi:hypothetical protein